MRSVRRSLPIPTTPNQLECTMPCPSKAITGISSAAHDRLSRFQTVLPNYPLATAVLVGPAIVVTHLLLSVVQPFGGFIKSAEVRTVMLRGKRARCRSHCGFGETSAIY